jgi:hypothetical protein
MLRHLTRFFILLALLASAGPAVAGEIFHWVDEQGVKHYSQSPPETATEEVSTLEVDGSQPASYDPNEDRYNVAAQEAAMQEMRDKMAESRKNKQKPPSDPQNTVIYYPQEEQYDQLLYPPGFWNDRPHRPGDRPRPPKPVQPLPQPNPPVTLRPNRP